ncbi:hypothetical protein B0H11DRAFT_2015300 [Mycena galericulata]|nr:hypothetical protein B0H11DRAFT_2015300 [Mycena galericulata]
MRRCEGGGEHKARKRRGRTVPEVLRAYVRDQVLGRPREVICADLKEGRDSKTPRLKEARGGRDLALHRRTRTSSRTGAPRLSSHRRHKQHAVPCGKRICGPRVSAHLHRVRPQHHVHPRRRATHLAPSQPITPPRYRERVAMHDFHFDARSPASRGRLPSSTETSCAGGARSKRRYTTAHASAWHKKGKRAHGPATLCSRRQRHPSLKTRGLFCDV